MLLNLTLIGIQIDLSPMKISIYSMMKMLVREIIALFERYDNNLVICHGGGLHIQLLDELIQEVAKILNIRIDWDTETLGCIGRTNRPLNTTFEEIASWFVNPKNSKEFTIFMFDDQTDLQEWDKVKLLVNSIHAYFGKKVFTPIDKQKFFPTRWPSLSELNKKGKNIMFVSRTNYGAEMNSTIFNRNDIWNESGARDPWKPFPTCTSGDLTAQKGNYFTHSKICQNDLCHVKFH